MGSDEASYWIVVRKMAIAVSIAAGTENVRLLQAGHVDEERVLEKIAHRPAEDVIYRLERILGETNLSGDELDVLEDVSGAAVGDSILNELHRDFVRYAPLLHDLTFVPSQKWSWDVRALDIVVRLKAWQFRGAVRQLPRT